ncbi:MAG: hypothetical protein HOL01_15360 [Planctomycetaceae bacterium]|nr:hypothetical protein [Planctomycetaceae bacterium]
MITIAAASCYLALAGLMPAATEHDPFTGPVEVLRYSFDNEDELNVQPGLWQPRGWTRRKGAEFPSYVKTGIDQKRGHDGDRSLRFNVNGGQAINYSPAVNIDSLHSYVFQGYIRTQLLKNDAALLSVSFLNHKRQRVQRFLSQPVSGTHKDWVRVRIGPIAPRDDVRFVVIGCHLSHGKKMDIAGTVWFDELFLGKLPQLSLVSNFHTHFKQRFAPIEITANVSGLDLDSLFKLTVDSQSEVIETLVLGDIPDELKAKMAEHAPPLSDQASIRLEREGRWNLTDNDRSFLVIQEDARALAVYDTRSPFSLQLKIMDGGGKTIDETTFPLDATPPERGTVTAETAEKRDPKTWKLKAKEYGYYRVQSSLDRDGVIIIQKHTSFAVIELTDQVRRGEFGWSIQKNVSQISPRELADVAEQAGINWLKHPVWKSAYSKNQKDTAQVAEMFDRLAHRGVTPIGLLSDPPAEIRKKFARDWTGVSEIFALPRSSWSPWLEPVIARYSSNVQNWQLGDDEDTSFVGMATLPQTILNVKREFDRIGRNTQIGIRWNWKTPLPSGRGMPQTFLSFDDMNPEFEDEDDEEEPPRPLTGPQLIERLQAMPRTGGHPRWVLIEPQRGKLTPEERGADLVKRMVSAKIGGADAIFATNIFHAEYGLLQPVGSPGVLFLPWRTTALALQGATFLGSFNLPGGSTNFVFARDTEVVLIIWNDDEDITEEIYLGEKSRIISTDLWGRERRAAVSETTNRQVLQVTSMPQIIRGCSKPVAEWRLAAQFQEPRLPSATGKHPNAIIGRNTFSQGLSGTAKIKVPPEWKIEPSNWPIQLGPGEKLNLPMELSIPPNTSLGNAVLAIDFEIDADIVHNFRVYRPIEIGLGDVFMHVVDRKLPDGRLEIEQIIVNRTFPQEILDFNCNLFARGNRRQKKRVSRMGNGKTPKRYYLPNADSLRGVELWLRAEQIDGRRLLNFRWTVGKYWDLPQEEFDEMIKQLYEELDKPPKRSQQKLDEPAK